MAQVASSSGSPPAITLHLGDRTLVVEATPLAKSPQNRLGIVVGQPQPNLLRLKQPMFRPVPWQIALVLIVIAVPVGLAVFVVLLHVGFDGMRNSPDPLFLAFIGICITFFVVLMGFFGRRPPARFRGQQLRISRFTLQRGRLIADRIIAVQLLFGRADEDLRADHPSFQINLILDNPTHSRVGFITYRDAEWTRAAARKLADYLGVPLVDQLPAAE